MRSLTILVIDNQRELSPTGGKWTISSRSTPRELTTRARAERADRGARGPICETSWRRWHICTSGDLVVRQHVDRSRSNSKSMLADANFDLGRVDVFCATCPTRQVWTIGRFGIGSGGIFPGALLSDRPGFDQENPPHSEAISAPELTSQISRGDPFAGPSPGAWEPRSDPSSQPRPSRSFIAT